MDIRELRIEDRVSHNGDIGEVVEIKTTHARLLFKDDTSYLYNVNELEPIPLTDELLKKIGFECHYTVPIYEYGNCMYDLMFNSFHYLSCDKNNIKYLHQLQHEIWETDIELKIEL